jgi:hypothetical protein
LLAADASGLKIGIISSSLRDRYSIQQEDPLLDRERIDLDDEPDE